MCLVSFGNRLRTYREIRKLSIKDVADAIDVPATTYREWEYGRAIKGIYPYIKIANFFDVSLHELLTGEYFDLDKDLNQCVNNIESELRKVKKILGSFK